MYDTFLQEAADSVGGPLPSLNGQFAWSNTPRQRERAGPLARACYAASRSLPCSNAFSCARVTGTYRRRCRIGFHRKWEPYEEEGR
jgi:hypothetical protein